MPKLKKYKIIAQIWEGCGDYKPQLKELLKNSIKDIQSVIDNDNSHLADIGIFISSIAENLNNVSRECFKQHKIEKDSLKNK